MPSPLPGLTAPVARNWAKGDILTAGKFRATPGDLAALYFNRPCFLGILESGTVNLTANVATQLPFNNVFLDNWGGGAISSPYTVQLPGWYLAECGASLVNSAPNTLAGVLQLSTAATGAQQVGIAVPNNINAGPVWNASQLYSLAAGQTITPLVLTTANSSLFTTSPFGNRFHVEWVGLQSGTVVTNPQMASLFPPGSGTVLSSSIAAGATSITVPNPIGMVTGGTLLLDYQTAFYEPVTITSVNYVTGVIGISATIWPHGGTFSAGLVLVPVSASFMNQQVRDLVNFLAYPPMLLAQSTSVATLAATVFPAGNVVPLNSITQDNFSGWNVANNWYVAPVNGVYYLRATYQGTAGTTAGATARVGYQINSGTVQWLDECYNPSATQFTILPSGATHVRLNKGDTISLVGQHDAGAALAISGGALSASPRLLLVWRGF